MKNLLLLPALIFFLVLNILPSGVLGQTNPAPQDLPYSQNFDGLPHSSSTYPEGWQGWRLTSLPGTTFKVSAPSADMALTANSTAATTSGNVHNYSGKIGFLNIGSHDLSLAVAINTTGQHSITVSFDIMTIRNPHDGGANTRINEVILQYRVGTTGDFTNLAGTEYQNNTVNQITGTDPQNLQSRTLQLPIEAEGQPVVQLRWVSRQVSGAGGRPSFAVDNINITVAPPTAPYILVSPTSLSGFSYMLGGGPSAEQWFEASGENLTHDIVITAPASYEVSLTSDTGFGPEITLPHSGGIVPATTVFVRLKAGLPRGLYDDTITVNSTGALGRMVRCIGAVTEPFSFFRSRATGAWHTPSSWEFSTDGLSWSPVLARGPESGDWGIRIRTGHTISVGASANADQVVIESGGILNHTGGTFTIVDGPGNDVEILTGGIFTFSINPSPVFATGSTCIVSQGAILRLATTGLTGTGAAIHSAHVIFQHASILEHTPGGAFAASGITFFPNVDATTIPIFRITTMTAPAGGTSPTIINGILEVNSSFTWAGAGTKTFRNGIRGPGAMSQGTSGPWYITGSSAVLGIAGGLTLGANGLTIAAGSGVSVTSATSLRGGPATVNGSLTINSGASITLGSGTNLTVPGFTGITNNGGTGGLVLHDGASLNHTAPVLEATMLHGFGGMERWRFISSPMEAQEISGPWTPPGGYPDGTGYDFYAWSEPGGLWLNQKVPTNFMTHFAPGTGYLVSFQQSDLTLPFAGLLNSGDIFVEIFREGTTPFAGFNLIGNPYPSGIDWNLADRSLFADNFAYIYDPSKPGGAGYITIDGGAPNALIGPNQGFFVLATAPHTFVFDNTMRRHGGIVTKSSEIIDRLILRLSQGLYFDETVIRVHGASAAERDRNDAIKMFSFDPAVPQLFSLSSDQIRLDVNSVGQHTSSLEFVLGLRAPGTGQYTLSLREAVGAFGSGDMFIRDLQTGVVHNLRLNPEFTFQAAQGENAGRFKLSFSQPTGIVEPPPGAADIYVYNRVLYLRFAREEANRQLQIIDLSGRIVLSQRLSDSTSQQILLDLEKGVYIVRITGHDSTKARRVMVR